MKKENFEWVESEPGMRHRRPKPSEADLDKVMVTEPKNKCDKRLARLKSRFEDAAVSAAMSFVEEQYSSYLQRALGEAFIAGAKWAYEYDEHL